MPEGRIALRPAGQRDQARLLVMDAATGGLRHAVFRDLPALLEPRSLVILNDTRVLPARLRGRKSTGGAAEILLVRRLDGGAGAAMAAAGPAGRWRERWEALAKLGHPKAGARLGFAGGVEAEIVERLPDGAVIVDVTGPGAGGVVAALESAGEMPIPPYIEAARRRAGVAAGAAVTEDRARYQTVYAVQPGAVAAPTAGLHFTPEVLAALEAAGHELARLTLHVGPGTFRPVEDEDPRRHHMTPERYEIPPATAAAVEAARAAKRPIVAVGTTVVRALEAAAGGGPVRAGAGETALYILPGFTFRVVTDMVTNFHLPRSTLLMLVCAFAGREHVLGAYDEAVRTGYRFYSYGDAMLLRGGRG